MSKSLIISAIIIACFAVFTAKAQSNIDAGISTHNYKHPNKAAQAKSMSSKKTVRVANLATVEGHYKRQNRGTMITTPKYAPRPAALVVVRTAEKEGNDLNPLLSPRNYKTPNRTEIRRNWEVADYYNEADSTNLPTVD